MKIYPHDYVVPTPPVPLVITAAQKEWVKNKLKAYMTNSAIGYELTELVKYIHEEAVIASNKHYPFKIIEEVILELDEEWGWHPEASKATLDAKVEEVK